MFFKKATKIDKRNLHHPFDTYCQIEGEDFVNFCGLLENINFKKIYKSLPNLSKTGIVMI